MGKQHVVTTARDLAVAAHGDQRHGDGPMIDHLDEVAVLVRDFGDTHQTVAYLHHILDDTDVTVARIEEAFGPVVAGCAALLATEPGANAKERTRLSYAKLANVSADDERSVALAIKTADRLLGVQTCYLNEDRGQLRKYRRDHREFRNAVYRPGIADDLWTELADLITS